MTNTSLYNVVQYHQAEGFTIADGRNKVVKVATIAYQKPYPLARSIMNIEKLKNNPKGTYFKLIKN